MKSIEPKKMTDILENDMEVDLNLRQRGFINWFISNIFGRALSYLVGWTGTAAKMLRCTSGGILKVATTGTIFESNDTKTGTSADAYTGGIAFDAVCSTVEVWIYTNDVLFKRSKDGITFDDEYTLESGSYHSFECSTLEFDIKSKAAGVHSTYQVIGWY